MCDRHRRTEQLWKKQAVGVGGGIPQEQAPHFEAIYYLVQILSCESIITTDSGTARVSATTSGRIKMYPWHKP